MTGPVQPTVHLAVDANWERVACDKDFREIDDEGADRATANRAQVTCEGCKAADASPEPLLTGLAALRLARRVGIAHTRSLMAKDAYDQVKLAASAAFAQMRRRGIPGQEIRLPGGEKVALISIEQGSTSMTVDPDLLTVIAAGNNPGDFEDYVEVRAFTDRRVIRLIAEQFPELVGRRLSDRALADYRLEAEENGGAVLNRKTGEREQVAEIARHEPTGKFAVRFTPKGRQLLIDALDSGAVNELGESAEDEDIDGQSPARQALGTLADAILDRLDGADSETPA